MGVGVVVAVAPGALRGQTENEAGTPAGRGIACGGTELGIGVVTAARDERAETVDGRSGSRTGFAAGAGDVGLEAGRRRGWVGAVGGAERSRAEVGAYGAAEEGG